jgi:hypothetical protein
MNDESIESRLKLYMDGKTKDSYAKKIFDIRAAQMDFYLRKNNLPPVRCITGETAAASELPGKKYWIVDQNSVDALTDLLHESAKLSRSGKEGFVVRYFNDTEFGFSLSLSKQGMEFLNQYTKRQRAEQGTTTRKKRADRTDARVVPAWRTPDHMEDPVTEDSLYLLDNTSIGIGAGVKSRSQMQTSLLEQNALEGAENFGKPARDEDIVGSRTGRVSTYAFIVGPVKKDLNQIHHTVQPDYFDRSAR